MKPPDTLKSRGVACGNYIDVSGIEVYSGGVEAASLRVTLRMAKIIGWTLISTDVGTAFLNAPLELPYQVLIYPPNVCVLAGVCDPTEIWLVHKAIYGLRESPKAWGDYRDGELRKMVVFHQRWIRLLGESKTWKPGP